jgi:hypothetical protein
VLRDVPLDAALFVPALSAYSKSCQIQIKQNQRNEAYKFIDGEKNSSKKSIGSNQYKRSTAPAEPSSNPSWQKQKNLEKHTKASKNKSQTLEKRNPNRRI